MNRRSLTFRLVSWYCGLLLVLGGAFAIFAYVSFDRYVEQADRRALAIRADAIWSMAAGLLGDSPALTDLIQRRFAPEAQSRFIRISSAGGVLYRSGDPVGHEFDPASVPLPDGDAPPRLTRVGDLVLYVKSFAGPDGRRITVESGQSADQVVTAERRLMLLLMFALPLLLIFAAGGGYALVRRALSPVESMIEAAEALTFNSPRNRLPLAGTGDRIDALGRTLNRMLERLDRAYQQASRFSADAAHELRTPLAIMRGELELLAAQPALPDYLQRAIGNVLGEAVRLSQIVDSLIAMSQMESVSGKRAHRPVDLRALAAETIDQIRLLADEKNIAIVGPSGASAVAAGDRDRLKQVLVNLLDNAVKYSDPGGRISVGTFESGDMAVLEVADTGVGIPAEHLPHIFNRFFRVDADRGEIGAGLGLAIVRSICSAHGGAVEAESLAGRGSVFRVTLPRATEALILGDAEANVRT
jgi:signal transduction histidine kinase